MVAEVPPLVSYRPGFLAASPSETGKVMTSLITTPFTAESTAEEVVDGIDLAGRRVVVTGGASGIGIETAPGPAGAGAAVALGVPHLEAGERAAEGNAPKTGSEQVLVAPPDPPRHA